MRVRGRVRARVRVRVRVYLAAGHVVQRSHLLRHRG